MLSTVERPSTVSGRAISTRGSLAVRLASVSAETPTPGMITPPRYSPPEVTTSRVVAVPQSTTIRLRDGWRWTAAIEPAMRSAPTSSGLRYRTLSPVFTPAWRTNGSQPKYLLMAPRVEWRAAGTTEHSAARSTERGSTPLSRSTETRKMPSSSEEPRGWVDLRNWERSASASKAPPWTCVLPMSRQRSMAVSGDGGIGRGEAREDALERGRQLGAGRAAHGRARPGEMDLGRELVRPCAVLEPVVDDEVRPRAGEEGCDRGLGPLPGLAGRELEGDDPHRAVQAAPPQAFDQLGIRTQPDEQGRIRVQLAFRRRRRGAALHHLRDAKVADRSRVDNRVEMRR